MLDVPLRIRFSELASFRMDPAVHRYLPLQPVRTTQRECFMRICFHHLRALALVCLVAVLVGRPMRAETKQQSDRREAVTVQVKIERQDAALPPALKQQNFRLLENGAPQNITGFRKSGSEYTITYNAAHRAQDNSSRKIKVELVDDTGQPLKMRNENGKDVKYSVIAREGYKAKQQVE